MGGSRKTVAAGVDFVKGILAESNTVRRETIPASALTVALQCGGSDGYSGVSANPALGAASDLIVRNGGSVILSETPETYGAEHLLTRRAVSPEVGRETGRPDALVGGLHEARGCRNERQPLTRQQGRRADHDSGKVSWRDGQSRQHQPCRCRSLRRGGDGARLRLHGYARLRSRRSHRAGRRRRQPGVLHHRPRQRVRLQAGALDQAGDQYGDVSNISRTIWT